MRPTTKDLAKHLGMSRSTVDRVLNGRPGVKKATVKAVNDAIKELGFERNLSAANLARRRVYRFAFLLPVQGGDFLIELQSQINDLAKALITEGIDIDVRRVLEADQHKTVEYLARLSHEQLDGIAILSLESPQVRDALTRLVERGVHVVRLIDGQTENEQVDFVGIDNEAAGQTAARLLGSFSERTEGHVAVVTDSMASPVSASRRHGFDSKLQEKFPLLSALPTFETFGDASRTCEILKKAFENFPDMAGVYIMNSEAATVLDALPAIATDGTISIVAHERTPTTLKHLAAEKISALIVQDPGHVVRSAARKLRAKCDNRTLLPAQDDIRIEILLKENLANQHLERIRDA